MARTATRDLHAPSVMPLPTGNPASRSVTYLIRSLLPGKGVALRPLPPLRTVHESFPSHGSSLSKASHLTRGLRPSARLEVKSGVRHHPGPRQRTSAARAYSLLEVVRERGVVRCCVRANLDVSGDGNARRLKQIERRRGVVGESWYVDETYIKVDGRYFSCIGPSAATAIWWKCG